jgi:hypothetical protein
MSPIRREQTPDNAPLLVVNNTAVVGTAAGPVLYRFELAEDLSFGRVIAIWTVPRTDGPTTSVRSTPLGLGTEYYWRVSATDGNYTSPLSIVQAFQTPAPAPAPAPPPAPVPQPPATPPPGGGGGGGGGTVGPNRSISPQEALQIIRGYHDGIRANLGSGSTREQRVEFFWSAMAAVHYGHPVWNPRGGDSDWCVKDAGGGRPPSDDVMTRCSSRESWDIIGGAGANGYSFHLDYIGRLPGDQNVYPPPRSSLPR